MSMKEPYDVCGSPEDEERLPPPRCTGQGHVTVNTPGGFECLDCVREERRFRIGLIAASVVLGAAMVGWLAASLFRHW